MNDALLYASLHQKRNSQNSHFLHRLLKVSMFSFPWGLFNLGVIFDYFDYFYLLSFSLCNLSLSSLFKRNKYKYLV